MPQALAPVVTSSTHIFVRRITYASSMTPDITVQPQSIKLV